MKMTFRRSAALLTLLALAAPALADTYIKGTQVSYNKDIDADTKVNNSSVFIDEANDTKNKNYAEFTCDEGAPIFYLNSAQALTNKKQYDDDETPDILVKIDGGPATKFQTWGANDGDKPDMYSLALDDKYDAQMLRIFRSAKTKVTISVTRFDLKTLNFTFYTKGLEAGLKAINNCK